MVDTVPMVPVVPLTVSAGPLTGAAVPPYRVSTITCNASVGVNIDLTVFFDNILISQDGYIWIEYGLRTKGTYPKRKKDSNANSQSSSTTSKKKCFDNQATVIYKMYDSKNAVYFPNIKLFRNGSIQMTGIRTAEDGEKVAHFIGAEVSRIRETLPTVVTNSTTDASAEAVVSPGGFKIRMINCDFGVPFKIRRKKLHQLLITHPHNNACSFQPVDYPGVKLQYFWNTEAAYASNGNCMCDIQCFGKGSGTGPCQCKKVTVSVFDSGKILITGANSFAQVNDAYKYICDVIYKNEEAMKKVMPTI